MASLIPCGENNLFLRYYKQVGYWLLNIIILFVVLNCGLAMLYGVYGYFMPTTEVEKKYGLEKLTKVYPAKSAEEINLLLDETWSRPVVYEAFTQFREKEFHGTYVNVSPHGFRISSNQGPWHPAKKNFNVFLFGGSTTFGYGVADAEAIGSQLQILLPPIAGRKVVKIYNWGRGFYYSTQERILFEQLLGNGFVPDAVIFIDGLNEFYRRDNEPVFTGQLQRFMYKPRVQQMVLNLLPVTRFVRDVKMVGKQLVSSQPPQQAEAVKSNIEDEKVARKVLATYRFNKKIIEVVATSYNIPVFFVWQPTSSYQYDQRFHLFSEEDEWLRQLAVGYDMMEKERQHMGENFVWAAGIQQEMKTPLYVDRVHYTAAMNGGLAQFIAKEIQKRQKKE